MARKLSHNGLVELKVKNGDPRETYAGLLWEAARKGYKHGWVCHKFREIFGKWPRPKSKVEPTPPDSHLREFLQIINGRYRAHKKREEAAREAREAAVVELKSEGLMPSFMTPEDWDVKL